ncbi:MAG: pyrroline-5-carboxylate reductase [Pseudomonadota bacterium]
MTNILMIGYGNMGRAVADPITRDNPEMDVCAIHPSAQNFATEGVSTFESHSTLAAHKGRNWTADWLIVAIKPQMMETVLPAYESVITKGARVISLVAGWPLARFESLWGADVPVIRAMPNTPAALGMGVTPLIANRAADESVRTDSQALLASCGETLWLTKEAQMDEICAISGSGPAYVFLLTEALAEIAERAGLSTPDAHKLARQTVIGSGALLAADPAPPDALRARVTSRAGVTAAAIKVLQEDESLSARLARAVAAGAQRARELG